MNLPEDLSKQEMEFWSWLTENHIIPDPLEFNVSKRNTCYRLASTEELRQLIADAFEKSDSQLADNLLEIASKERIMSEEIIRKSRRLKTGEYLKLLYIKRLEDTSFSDIIVKILKPYTKKYLEDFASKWKTQLPKITERIDHLFKLIDSWDEMSPDSRSRAIDMGLRDYEGEKDVPFDYSHNLDELKGFLPDFYLSEIHRILEYNEGSIYRERPRVYQEFVKKWKADFDEYPIGNLRLNVSIDEENIDRLLFKPILRLSHHLSHEEQLELFEKYGETDVVGFINLFKPYAGGEKQRYHGSFDNDEKRDIFFWIDITLQSYSVTISNAIDYEIDYIQDSVIIDNLYRDFQVLHRMIKSLGDSVEIDDSKFFEKDNKRFEQRIEKDSNSLFPLHHHLRSETWNEFLKMATRLAKPNDFITIKKINAYRNKILNRFKVGSFVHDLVENSITSRSVVSFYVSKDVWRFLPLVIKEHDWYEMAASYLSN